MVVTCQLHKVNSIHEGKDPPPRHLILLNRRLSGPQSRDGCFVDHAGNKTTTPQLPSAWPSHYTELSQLFLLEKNKLHYEENKFFHLNLAIILNKGYNHFRIQCHSLRHHTRWRFFRRCMRYFYQTSQLTVRKLENNQEAKMYSSPPLRGVREFVRGHSG
jgi:hypothetical protein